MKKLLSVLLVVAMLCATVAVFSSCGAARKNVTVTVKDPSGIAVINGATGAANGNTAKEVLANLGYISIGEDDHFTVNAAGCTEATASLLINGEAAEFHDTVADGDELTVVCGK